MSEGRIPAPPKRLASTGRKLWRAVMADFELSQPEEVLLRDACFTADLIDRLQAQVDVEGLSSESSQGPRVHPAVVELRHQRLTLVRLGARYGCPWAAKTTRSRPGAGAEGRAASTDKGVVA